MLNKIKTFNFKKGFSNQFMLGITITHVAIFVALIFSIEQPPFKGEHLAIAFVFILNLFWLIPYSIIYFKKHNFKNLFISFLIYLLTTAPFTLYILRNTPFNSMAWKTEFNGNINYDKFPAHSNGNMVANIIESKMLIGQPLSKIENVLGNNYYITTNENRTTLWYFYASKNIFDGCDKLSVTMEGGSCIDACFGGCG